MADDTTSASTLQVASIFDQLLATRLSDAEFEEAMNKVSDAYFNKRSELLSTPLTMSPSTSLTLMQRLTNMEILVAEVLSRLASLEAPR